MGRGASISGGGERGWGLAGNRAEGFPLEEGGRGLGDRVYVLF